VSKDLSIKKATQLAIFLPNRPGALMCACEALAKAKVNIDALATEGGSFGQQKDEMLVRIVVNDRAKAVTALSEVGAGAIETDVLMIEGSNQPGTLAKIADQLAKFQINMEWIYMSASSEAEKCVFILRPTDVERAMRALSEL
jgi:hypothetical protein